MLYGDLNDIPKRRITENILPNKAFNIAKIQKYDKYQ